MNSVKSRNIKGIHIRVQRYKDYKILFCDTDFICLGSVSAELKFAERRKSKIKRRRIFSKAFTCLCRH